jgi:hypothetical protein
MKFITEDYNQIYKQKLFLIKTKDSILNRNVYTTEKKEPSVAWFGQTLS